MANNHMDMLSIFSPREMQVKTTMRVTPIRMDQIKQKV